MDHNLEWNPERLHGSHILICQNLSPTETDLVCNQLLNCLLVLIYNPCTIN